MPNTNTGEKERWWESDLREFVDKAMKPKKPTMKNLERELLVDFVRRVESHTIERIRKEIEKYVQESIKDPKSSNYIYAEIVPLNILDKILNQTQEK